MIKTSDTNMFPQKIKLANTPTPLETIVFEEKKLICKRDDLTGLELSGNKVRKLEYLLYQAKREKADTIFTCGASQSNHARAAVIASSGAGFKTHLFLWGKDSHDPDGNLFLSKYFGAKITYLNKKEYSSVNKIMFREREKEERSGKNVYVIPEGGSTTIGIRGYISFMNELLLQTNLGRIKGIVTASGTGGTAAGLLVGAALNKLDLKVYAVNVLYPADVIKNKILMLAEAGILENKLDINISEKNLVILNGYSEEGYKNITSDKLKLIKKFARTTGILLDPAYTDKAFAAYYDHFLTKDLGMKNIFLHTGGLYGVFAKRKEYLQY